MKLKIIDLREEKPFTPDGKPYTIWHWTISGELDGVHAPFITLKSFTKEKPDIKPGDEIEISEAQTDKQGNTFYTPAKKDKPAFQQNRGYSKPSYTMQEYDLLFNHSVLQVIEIKELFEINKIPMSSEMMQSLIGTFHIGACQAGVKVISEHNKPGTPLDEFYKPESEPVKLTKMEMYKAINMQVNKDPELKKEWDKEWLALGNSLSRVDEVQMEELYHRYIKNL